MIEVDDYVVDVLMRDLVGHDRKLVSFLVYLWVAAEQRRSKGVVKASYQQIAECIGVSKSSTQAAVGWLIKRKLLACTKETVTATPCYRALTPGATTKPVLAVARSENDAVTKMRRDKNNAGAECGSAPVCFTSANVSFRRR
jgi:hypothetical protein